MPLFDTAEAPVRKVSRLAIVAARLLPSLIALGGVIVLNSAPSAEGAGTALKQEEATLGIVFSLVSAVCYAMHTMRLSEYADVDPTAQASGQVLVNALLDVAAMPVAAMLTTANEGSWLASAPREALRRLALAACWNGVFVVGATTWAMSFAQQACSPSKPPATFRTPLAALRTPPVTRVPSLQPHASHLQPHASHLQPHASQAFSASTAALAYAMEPLFAALFAAAILHESIHELQLLGGALVVRPRPRPRPKGPNPARATRGDLWCSPFPPSLPHLQPYCPHQVLANVLVAVGSTHVLSCFSRHC